MSVGIVFGVFKGMGDLICASPVIQAELQRDRSVHLLLFPGATIREFCSLIDFSPHQHNLYIHTIPPAAGVTQWKRFITEIRCIAPETVWISPHAPAKDSSWKIPLGLRTLQLLFWRNARLVGADTERLSLLLHRRLPVDRSLPLQKREWSAYCLFRGSSFAEEVPNIRFIDKIEEQLKATPRYDLVIHPGANAKNRTWPFEKYAPLIAMLPSFWRVAFVGFPADLELIRRTLPSESPIEYITGTIGKSIETLATARLLFVMDSGNMHFAQVLGAPAVVVFGYTDPADIIDLKGVVKAIYQPHLPCQPCRKKVCSQPSVYCLDSIEPEVVANKLKAEWEKLELADPRSVINIPT